MIRGLIVAVTALALFAGTVHAKPEEFEIDEEHFSIAFQIQHAGLYDVFGMFTEGEGEFVFDEEALTISDIKIEIETDSVYTAHKKRDGHLRSGDFLNAREFPKITFVGTGSERTGDRTGRVTGDLTLLGVTRPVTLEVEFVSSGPYLFNRRQYRVGINAQTTIKRSDFGMTYALDNNGVGDEVKLFLGFEAIRD